MAIVWKTIRIREQVLKKLHEYQWPRESLSSVIERMVEGIEKVRAMVKAKKGELGEPGGNHG